MCELLLAWILAVWLAVSYIAQFHRQKLHGLLKWDLIGLVPAYTFFGYNAVLDEYRFYYRHGNRDGRVAPWSEIPVVPEPSYRWLFWSPDRRRYTAFLHAVIALRETAKCEDKSSIRSSMPYLLLAAHACAQPREPWQVVTQFLVSKDGDPSGGISSSAFMSDMETGLGTME